MNKSLIQENKLASLDGEINDLGIEQGQLVIEEELEFLEPKKRFAPKCTKKPPSSAAVFFDFFGFTCITKQH